MLSGPIQQRQNLHRMLQDNQQRIELLEQQLQATHKLASLGTMACLAAHEFNNILTPMINYAELALKNQDDLPLMRKALEKTVKHGNRAAIIIQSMLGIVRGRDSEPQKIKLAPLVDECFQCLARDFKKDQITVKRVIPDNLEINAVATQLQQVLLNLIINARQAMIERGGTLTISADTSDADFVAIEIRDTGPGIEPDIIEKIFEPFYSTKTHNEHHDQKGTGLGLSVCKTIIDAHGGSIDVQSTPGQGATFTIRLPNI